MQLHLHCAVTLIACVLLMRFADAVMRFRSYLSEEENKGCRQATELPLIS